MAKAVKVTVSANHTQFHKEDLTEKTMDKSEILAGTGRYSSACKVMLLVVISEQI